MSLLGKWTEMLERQPILALLEGLTPLLIVGTFSFVRKLSRAE